MHGGTMQHPHVSSHPHPHHYNMSGLNGTRSLPDHIGYHKQSIFGRPYLQEFMRQSAWEKITSICTAALGITTFGILVVLLFI